MDYPTLSVSRLAAAWSPHVLSDMLVSGTGVDLSLDRGEWCLVLGNNGSGKSTLLSALGGLCPYVDGRIEVMGYALNHASVEQRFQLGVQLVPQEVSCHHEWTTDDVCEMAFRKRQGIRHERALRCFFDRIRSSGFNTDGRMLFKPRVARLLSAVLSCPTVVLLDEVSPLMSGFDSLKDGYAFLKSLMPDSAVVFTEHATPVALQVANKVVEISGPVGLPGASGMISRSIPSEELVQMRERSLTSSKPSNEMQESTNDLKLLAPDRAAREHMDLAIKGSGLEPETQRRILKQALSWWSFLGDREKPIEHFSGGMKVITHSVMRILITGRFDPLNGGIAHLHCENRERLANLMRVASETGMPKP